MPSDRIAALRLKASAGADSIPVRTPIAYGYSRVSHANSFQKGESLPAQEMRIKSYWESHLREKGIALGSIENDGTNVSAYSVPFAMRPAGKSIMTKIQPGDHIILDKVDRIWRSIEDFCHLMKELRRKNITVHIVNFLGQSIQNDTPLGDFILRQFVLVAELESAIKSERIKEGLANAKAKRGVSRAYKLPGTERHRVEIAGRKVWKLRWNQVERSVMQEIVRMRDSGMEWAKCWPKIEELEAKVQCRPVRKGRELRRDIIVRWPNMYKYELAYEYLNITDPNSIPQKDKVLEAARQARRERVEKKYRLTKKYTSWIERIPPEELIRTG